MILTFILSVILWLLVTIATIVSFLIVSIMYFFCSKSTLFRLRSLSHIYIVTKFMQLLRIWKVQYIGLANINPTKQYIIIANHASMIDSIFMADLPINFRYLVASKYRKIPVFGWTSSMVGDVGVNKSSKTTKKKCLNEATVALNKGLSLMIYPEGRRSNIAPDMLSFQKGAFMLAQQNNIEILPITIHNGYKALEIGGTCGKANVIVNIHRPICFYNISVDEMSDHCRTLIFDNLKSS